MTDFATEAQATEVQSDLPAEPVAGPPLLEGYQLESRVGIGSFGEVWAAIQLRTGQRVAVKLLSPQQGLDWSYFRQEVERLQEVAEHPHVVTLLDADLEAARPYYVMPLLRQGSLGDLKQRAEIFRVSGWLKEIAAALQFTHDKGILHCDLKPSNVLLDDQGRTRLVDFGQARLREAASGALGTLGFMAPEQAEPRALPSARWDVYSLGATAYFLLTGALPRLSADDLRTLRSGSLGSSERIALYRSLLAASRLVPLRHLNPEVDEELAAIVERSLEPDPARRTASAADVLADLERRERHEPLMCRRPWSRAYRLRTWLRRPSSLMVLLLLACVLGFLGLSGWQMSEHSRELQAINDGLFKKMGDLRVTTQNLRRQVFAHMLGQADMLEGQQDLHAALLLRSTALSHAGDETLRLGLKANSVRLVSLEQLPGCTGLVAGGERYLVTLGATPRLYDVFDGQVRRLPVGDASSAWFSPDLQRLAVLRDGGKLTLLSLPDLKVLESRDDVQVAGFAGRRLVTARSGNLIPLSGGPFFAERHSHPDGVKIRALAGGRTLLQVNGSAPERVVVSPDARRSLVIWPSSARLYSLQSGQPLGAALPYTLADAAFSPRGDLLALAGRDTHGHQTWVYEPGHDHPTFRLFHPSPVTRVAFSRDGAKLMTASQDGDVRRFSMRTGRPVPGIFHHGAGVTDLATVGSFTFGLAQDQTLRQWKGLHPAEILLPGPVKRVAFAGPNGAGQTLLAAAGVAPGGGYIATSQNLLRTSWPVCTLAVSTPRLVGLSPNGDYASWRGARREFSARSGFARVRLAVDGTLALLDASGLRVFPPEGPARQIHPQPDVVGFALAQSGDGQRLADLYRGQLTLWEGSGPPQSVAGPLPSQLTFSPDGKWLAQLGPGTEATVWNVTMGKLSQASALPLATAAPATAAGPEQQLEFSPNAQYLAAPCWEGLQLWANPWNEPPRLLRTQSRDIAGNFAFSPDSRRLAWAGRDGTMQIWDLASGRRLLPWLPFPWSFRSLAFSPDGDWLALGCEEGSVQLLDLQAAEVPLELDTGCRLNDETGQVETLSVAQWQERARRSPAAHSLFEGRDPPAWARLKEK